MAGPVEFEGAVGAGLGKSACAGPQHGAQHGGRHRYPWRVAEPAMAYMDAEELAASTAVAATGQAQGEFFSYVVGSPVTVRRGRSAMVPILQAQLKFRKERIYNGRKQPRNPVITARFVNDTGLTLERGPLTVIEAGEYAGDAMVPFTAPGRRDLPGLRRGPGRDREGDAGVEPRAGVSEHQGWYAARAGVRHPKVTYLVENRGDEAVRITLEHAKLADYTPFDTPDPVESTADYHRYVVDAPSHGVASFMAKQRRMLYRREEVRVQKLDQLARWLRDKVLDEQVYDAAAPESWRCTTGSPSTRLA